MKDFNTFLRVKTKELKCAMRSTNGPKDFGDLDESRRKAKLTKRGAVESGCYRICKSSGCAALQKLLIQV